MQSPPAPAPGSQPNPYVLLASPPYSYGADARPLIRLGRKPIINDLHKPCPDFPRSDHTTSDPKIAPPPYGKPHSVMSSLWAAKKASSVWRAAIEKEAKRSNKSFDEARAPADDTCFALAVFDKMWELHAYARGFKDFFERPARSYKQWLVMVDDWFAYVYDVACKRLPPSSVPPAYEWTHAYVRSCMDLWCGLEDVFDPPKGRWRRFDNRKLGQYHWKYHDLCYPFYTLDRRVRGGIRENWVTHKALPWPPTEEPEPNTQRKKTRTMRPIMRNARTWDGKVWRVKKTVETYVLYESELKRDKPVSPETQPPIVTALPTSSSTSSAATAPSDPPGVPAPLPAAVAPPPTARVRPVAPATTSAMRHAWYRDSLGGVSRSS